VVLLYCRYHTRVYPSQASSPGEICPKGEFTFKGANTNPGAHLQLESYIQVYTYAQLYLVVCVSIPILHTKLTHHALACYVTKFESQSFRLRSKNGVAFAQQESCWRSLRLSQGVGQSLPFFYIRKVDCTVVQMQVTAQQTKVC